MFTLEYAFDIPVSKTILDVTAEVQQHLSTLCSEQTGAIISE